MHPASTHQTISGHLSGTPWGSGLYPGARITALIPSGEIRRCEITGHADTFFSIPARASIGGRKVAGYVSSETLSGMSTETEGDPAVFRFNPYARTISKTTRAGKTVSVVPRDATRSVLPGQTADIVIGGECIGGIDICSPDPDSPAGTENVLRVVIFSHGYPRTFARRDLFGAMHYALSLFSDPDARPHALAHLS
jgi:hypothetical protein